MAITLTFPRGGALVTGGTGRVGEGIVRRLAEAGVPLVFTYKSSDHRARAIEEELLTKGLEVCAHAMDTADSRSIDAALDKVASLYGRIHTIACGSGTPVSFDKLADFPVDYVERFLNDDAMGYYRIFHAAVPRLRAGGGGSITTCTTMALRRYIAFDGISPFSKGSVAALVQQIAVEEAEHGIRCNAVAIGWVTSATYQQIREATPSEDPVQPATSDERALVMRNQLLAMARTKRPATPAEAGDVFTYLASDQASYLTGQNLTLDGGMTL